MFFASLFALSTTLGAVFAQDTNVDTVLTSLRNNRVIPDVLADFTPAAPLDVTFGKINVTAGQNLTIQDTANEPTFSFLSTDTNVPSDKFLIAMVDPDAPTPQNPTSGQILHLLSDGFTSTTLTNGTSYVLSTQTTPTAAYMGPKPPNGSTAHRYVIAAYLQFPNFTIPAGFNAANRSNFKLSQFVDNNGQPTLRLLAATFFYVGPASNKSSGAAPGVGTFAPHREPGLILGLLAGAVGAVMCAFQLSMW